MSNVSKILAILGVDNDITDEQKAQLEALEGAGNDDDNGGSVSIEALQKSLNAISGAQVITFEGNEFSVDDLKKSLKSAATVVEGMFDGQEKLVGTLNSNQAALLKSLSGFAQNQTAGLEAIQAVGEVAEEMFERLDALKSKVESLEKSLGTPRQPRAITTDNVTVIPSPRDPEPSKDPGNILLKSMAEFNRIQDDPAQYDRALALSQAIGQMEGGVPQSNFAHLFPAS